MQTINITEGMVTLDDNYSIISTAIPLLKEKELANIMNSFLDFLLGEKPEYNDEQVKHWCEFFCNVPISIYIILVERIHILERRSDEFRYFTKLHVKMLEKFKEYDDLVHRIIAMSEEEYNDQKSGKQ